MKKKLVGILLSLSLLVSLAACGGGGSDKVIIYSNADEEAIQVIENVLNENGYEGQYEIQTFGTSELGGKLLAEGTDIEADMVTMSSFYLESAQDAHDMFVDFTWDVNTEKETPKYIAPLTAQEGAIIVNEKMAEESNLDLPKSIKDLADPKYQDLLAVVDIDSSSTAWLMTQALIETYGEEEATDILAGIYKNANNHIEASGSGPLNKVASGEVPLGFGLRHQVLQKANEGIPVSIIDPEEGNFTLSESLAIIKKDNQEKIDKMQEMTKLIIEKGRPEIQKVYPGVLYQGETAPAGQESNNLKTFSKPLTAELLKEHQDLSTKAKGLAQGK
ncbi:extracellular solute-binding protein [Peptococcus simiae]|uniref:Extracellular solute-binding protein n=1 Tax=Peptococcus simiae TaxID=1643805 RepID=A0ABW9GXD2_9FIRM